MTKLLARGRVFLIGLLLGLLLIIGYGELFPIQAQDIPILNEIGETISTPLTSTQPGEEAPQVSEVPQSFPVTLDGVVLWQVFNPLGELTAQQRANGQSERIAEAAADFSIKPEDIIVGKDPSSTSKELLIKAKYDYLLLIQPEDAKVVGMTEQELAQKYIKILREAFLKYRERRSLHNIIQSVAWILLATLALVFIIYLINRFFAITLIPLTSFNGLITQGVKGMELGKRTKALIIKAIRFFLKATRIVVYLFVVFFYIIIVLILYPFSNESARNFNEFVRSNIVNISLSFLNYLPNLFVIGLIGIIAYYTLKFSNIVFEEVKEESIKIPGFYSDWAEPTGRLVSVLIVIMAIMIASPYLPGFDSPAAKGITLFLGVLFSIGSSGSIANIISGVLLVYTRAFRIGDFVEIEGTRGKVIENTLLVTRIRTYLNEIISIPNSKVLTSTITNLTIGIDKDHPGVAIKTTITLGYDNSWRKVYETLCKAAVKTKDILAEPAPYVFQSELSDFYVAYTIHAYTRNTDNLIELYSRLHENIQDCCNEVGIEIMSPHYTNLRDGNYTTIPADYLGSDYQAPGFRIEK